MILVPRMFVLRFLASSAATWAVFTCIIEAAMVNATTEIGLILRQQVVQLLILGFYGLCRGEQAAHHAGHASAQWCDLICPQQLKSPGRNGLCCVTRR